MNSHLQQASISLQFAISHASSDLQANSENISSLYESIEAIRMQLAQLEELAIAAEDSLLASAIAEANQ